VLTGVTSVTHFTTKSCMSRWTRAHAGSTGINWSVEAGPGGTMIVIEHEADRSTLTEPTVTPAAPITVNRSVQAWAS
jgi:hypothetical protein